MEIFIALGVLVIAGIWTIKIYNSLVTKKNRFKNAFAQIDVQLKRRHELIPNLIETVKGAMAHERETLTAVIEARNAAHNLLTQTAKHPEDASTMSQLNKAEGQLSQVLGRLFALTESYPDLKANQNMAHLQEELTSTENKVSFARQAFNDSVMDYNTEREIFPNSLIATLSKFEEASLFEVTDEQEKIAPKVKF